VSTNARKGAKSYDKLRNAKRENADITTHYEKLLMGYRHNSDSEGHAFESHRAYHEKSLANQRFAGPFFFLLFFDFLKMSTRSVNKSDFWRDF